MDAYSDLLAEIEAWLSGEDRGNQLRADLWHERLTEKFPGLPAADIKEAMLAEADKRGVIATFN
jgi:hypothetical protein